jgi:hypothetical protein
MLGYSTEQVEEMIYSINTSMLLINADENPAIYRGLGETASFLEGLISEGHL